MMQKAPGEFAVRFVDTNDGVRMKEKPQTTCERSGVIGREQLCLYEQNRPCMSVESQAVIECPDAMISLCAMI